MGSQHSRRHGPVVAESRGEGEFARPRVRAGEGTEHGGEGVGSRRRMESGGERGWRGEGEFSEGLPRHMAQDAARYGERAAISPLLRLWQRMATNLQRSLLGAFRTHGIVSTRKALASFRTDPAIALALEALEARTVVPGHDQDSTPCAAGEASCTPHTFKASPCVERTARSLLKEYVHEGIEGEGMCGRVSITQFFLRLVQLGDGPMLQQWRRDGCDHERVCMLLVQSERKLRARAHAVDGEAASAERTEGDDEGNNGDEEEEDDDTGGCSICMDAPVDCVVLECGHAAFCMTCASQTATCALCRQPITRVVRLFWS